jgi:hypothetical protein
LIGILGLLLPLALLGAPALPAAGTDPPRTARLARDILAEPRFQRAANHAASAAAVDARRRPDAGREGAAPAQSFPVPPAPPAGAAGAATGAAALLFKAVLVCVLAALVLALFSRLAAGRPKAKRPAVEVEPPPGSRAGGDPGIELDAADRLAAAGRFGEAVHALLLLAIGQLSGRSARPPAPSRTSRELVRLLPLEGAARDAFAALVALVERTLFGGCVAAVGDFQTARGQALLALAPAAGSRGNRGGSSQAGPSGRAGQGAEAGPSAEAGQGSQCGRDAGGPGGGSGESRDASGKGRPAGGIDGARRLP